MCADLLRYIYGTSFVCYIAMLLFCGHETSTNFNLSNFSLEPVSPTPLLEMGNDSADSARQKTENVSSSVSNISLNDIINDNDTQQLQMRYRERKKQERLILIQREILQILGFRTQPNFTLNVSEEERERMITLYDVTQNSYDINSTGEADQPAETCAENDDSCSG